LDESDDGEDLVASMAKLASLVSQREPFEQTLRRLADYSAQAIRGSERIAVCVLSDGRPIEMVATDSTVHDAELVQYELGEGPALTAVAERQVTRSAALGGDPNWPRFGSTVARAGLQSVLVAPMVLPGVVVGTLSVYSTEKDVFDEAAMMRAARYAVPAAAVIRNLHLLQQSQTQIEQLTDALRTRGVIDQAIGIIRSRRGGTSEEAFARLRRISNTEHIKLVDVAKNVVEQAARRANARRPTY
jgi:transcriptional regulator with GAF, ATPase, and Fis domain